MKRTGPRDVAVGPVKRKVQGGKARARSRYFERARAGHSRESDLITPLQSAQQFRARKPGPASETRIWRSLGPFSTPHGQTYGHGPGSRPSISGRISAIAVDPSDPEHVLIGSGAGGGVWETRTGGKTWWPRTDDQPSLFIGAIAFDSSNPRIVYAGTGEGDSIRKLGVGLLKSTDGGKNWKLISGQPFEGTGFYDLQVDPIDRERLYAGTTAGLYVSADAGATWRTARRHATWNISQWSPDGTGKHSCELLAACDDGVFRSTNGGKTWRRVNLPGAPAEWERIEVCHAPFDGNIAYAVAAGPPPVRDRNDPKKKTRMPQPYFWRREIMGREFARFSGPADIQTHQAWYDWCAATAPNNPDVLYVGAINLHKGVRVGENHWEWENLTARGTGDSIHPDQHALAFSPADPNVIYAGNDGGVFRTPDGGFSWQSLNKGLCITEIEFLAQHPRFESWMLAGTQDNGTLRYQGEEVWYHVADGDGGDCAANGSARFTCYHTFYGIGLRRSRVGGGWNTWDDRTRHMRIRKVEDYSEGALFYAPLEARGNVVAQAGRTVFISENEGTSWSKVALPAGVGRASALALPSTRMIVVGTETGYVFELRRGNQRWSRPRLLGRPAPGFVSDLLVDLAHRDRIWATYSHLASADESGKVFRSDDGGTVWTDVSRGLPPISMNAVEVDPQDSDTVFVAADVGVWRSEDAGATWINFSHGLPNALVKDLVFHPEARVLRAGTQARGVWEISVDDSGTPAVDVFVRDSTVDTGRCQVSPVNCDDPLSSGSTVWWWQTPDVKVDAPSFVRPYVDDVDFEVFEDDLTMIDRGIDFSSGLRDDPTHPARPVRVYVQVHNRGVLPARNVAVRVFFTNAAVAPPDLPEKFWDGFPENRVSARSRWQAIGPATVLSRVEPGRCQVAGFDWVVPAGAARVLTLLAAVSAGNEPFGSDATQISRLVRQTKKCAVKNFVTVNPRAGSGAPVRAVRLDLWRCGQSRRFSIGADWPGARMLAGVVFSRRMAGLARAVNLPEATAGEQEKTELQRLLVSEPRLRRRVDASTIFSPHGGTWLSGVTLGREEPEPLILLVHPRPHRGYGSVLQWDEQGRVVGGFTLRERMHS